MTATYNGEFVETISGLVSLYRESVNPNVIRLYRVSDGMFLQSVGSLSAAETRAAQMVSSGEVS